MDRFRKSLAEKILLAVCAALVIAQFGLISFYYRSLPQEVPIHYGITGEADSFGPKYFLWILAGISAFIFSLLYYHQNRGNKVQINWPIKEENREAVQVFVARWMRLIMLNIAWFLFYLLLGTILIALEITKKLNPVFMIVFVITNLVLIFGGIMRMQDINAGRRKA